MTSNFIDIDYTLWDNKSKWWVIDKKNPGKYICRIPNSEVELITSGFYKNDNLPINYNGIEGFISKELLSKLHKYKKIKSEDAGLSDREYKNDKLIKKQLHNFIEYSKNTNIFNNTGDYYLITKRGNKNAHKQLLNDTKNNIDIDISEEYFVSDNSNITNVGTIIERKLFIFLQHLIGYTINNNEFEPLIIKQYDELNYYTDTNIIDEYKNINYTLKKLLDNCPMFLKNKIESKIKLSNINFNIYVLTSNELNPFEKETITITVD